MTETLQFGNAMVFLGVCLLVHRAGLSYSIRVVGNWWWSLAYAVDCFRMEFRRMNDEARAASGGGR
jgi:hypothetical protein